MADTSVKMFSNEMSGAPLLGDAVDQSMVDVLDACLINGFGEVTLDSLTVSSDVATGSLSTGHGFTMYGTTSVGPVISISGATPAELNGEWRLDSVADANTFTFAVSGIADVTATGTITAKRAPAGWTIKFSDTDKRAYERSYIGSPSAVLYADHTDLNYPKIYLYEGMSDINTGTGGENYHHGYINDLATHWRLYASSSSMIFCFRETTTHESWNVLWVLDFDNFDATDVWNTCTKGYYSNSSVSSDRGHRLSYQYIEVLRTIEGGVAEGVSGYTSKYNLDNTLGYDNCSFPDANGNITLGKVTLWDSISRPRGVLRGIYDVVNARPSELDTFIDGFTEFPGKVFCLQYAGDSGLCAIDVVGPWDE